jgi:hypothetical protein
MRLPFGKPQPENKYELRQGKGISSFQPLLRALRDHPGTQKFIPLIPGNELALRNGRLFFLKINVHPAIHLIQSGLL